MLSKVGVEMGNFEKELLEQYDHFEKIIWDGVHVGYRLYSRGMLGALRFCCYLWLKENVKLYGGLNERYKHEC